MPGPLWPDCRSQSLGARTLMYRRLGAGPDLVFLHGLLGSGEQWRECALALAGGFTCWLLELPGVSRSSLLAPAGLNDLARWLEKVATTFGWQQFAILGSSWGGAMALAYAAAFPTRVRRMVLAAPAHPLWRPNLRQRLLLWPPLCHAAAWAGARLSWKQRRQLLEAMYGDPSRVTDESVNAYRERLCRPGLGAAVAAYARPWRRDQHALGRALGAIRVPALLVWGERDIVVPASTAPALCAALPDARLNLLGGLGHLAMEEDPAAFAGAVRPFLES